MTQNNKPPETIKTKYGTFVYDPQNDKKIFKKGYHQEKIVELAMTHAQDGVAIDVGAHIGTFTVPLAKVANKVHSFEPHPKTFKLLQENTKHLNNVSLYNLALSYQSYNYDNLTRKNLGGNTLKKRKEGKFKTVILDSVIQQKVDFIKIDVEGMELYVILGARKILKHRPTILYEHRRSIKHLIMWLYLKCLGYRLSKNPFISFTDILATHQLKAHTSADTSYSSTENAAH